MLHMLKTVLHSNGDTILLGVKTSGQTMVMAIIGILKWLTLKFPEIASKTVRLALAAM